MMEKPFEFSDKWGSWTIKGATGIIPLVAPGDEERWFPAFDSNRRGIFIDGGIDEMSRGAARRLAYTDPLAHFKYSLVRELIELLEDGLEFEDGNAVAGLLNLLAQFPPMRYDQCSVFLMSMRFHRFLAI